tara:strand:+ start:113830 stop:114945 length:1116 start_codon:yes stop_codon:yes gene_type:complete
LSNKHLIDNQELEALKKVLESGHLFRHREEATECDSFEKEFSEFIGTSSSCLVNSGTNALVAALRALDIKEGDEVIVPAYTFFATISSVLTVGATPVVVNIGSEFLLELDSIKEAVTKKTKAIIPVHMDGRPCEIDKICDFAKKENLFVIEDCAQALGATYKGKRLGSFGDLGCFSFNMEKTITCGEGGAITTNDGALGLKLKLVSDHAFGLNPKYKKMFEGMETILGSSMRVSELSGAMLRVQLKKVDSIIEENKKRKEILAKKLGTQIVEGECCSTLYLRQDSLENSVALTKKLLDKGITAMPMSMRLAHNIWQWKDYLSFNKIDYIETMEKLMGTVRIEIDNRKSLEQIEIDAEYIFGTRFLFRNSDT